MYTHPKRAHAPIPPHSITGYAAIHPRRRDAPPPPPNKGETASLSRIAHRVYADMTAWPAVSHRRSTLSRARAEYSQETAHPEVNRDETASQLAAAPEETASRSLEPTPGSGMHFPQETASLPRPTAEEIAARAVMAFCVRDADIADEPPAQEEA